MPQSHIFVTGATGYVGGTVLSLLLAHKDAPHFDITALVRSVEKGEKLKSATGINVVVGSHSDLELVEMLASKADVIFSMADCQDLELAKAQLRGAKKRYEATGKQSEFIHVSGTGCLADDSFGMYGPKEIIDDLDSERIAALPITQGPQRSVDIKLVEADEQGYVKTYIVLPGAIYGTATGQVANAGAQNTENTLSAKLCYFAFLRKEALLERGRTMADLLVLVYDSISSKIANTNTAHGKNGYYFAENGAYTMLEFAGIMQEVLQETGRAKAELTGPTQFTSGEQAQMPLGFLRILGGNVRCKSSRGRSIGWNPVKSEFLAALREELKQMAAGIP